MSAELTNAACIELPLNVRNVHKAIEMLGGGDKLARVTSEASFVKEPETLELRLREDEFHHPINSSVVRARNVVLEVELPKHILDGRTAKEALVLAKASGVDFNIQPKLLVGLIHRFREIADFQYYTGDIPFVRKTRDSLFAGNFEEIQTISLDDSKDASPHRDDILPPPRFSMSTQPFYYAYKQSPYVKIVDDDSGERRLVHTAASAKVISNLLTWGEPVPSTPPDGLEPKPRLPIQKCIVELKRLFAERPSYTRRSLQSLVGSELSRQLKFALPYVSYYYRSGPWRGAYIRYGVDPSKTPSMSQYQVEHFRISLEDQQASQTPDDTSSEMLHTQSISEKVPSDAEKRLVFDATNYPGVPMLQLCDVQDGFLEPYITTTNLRGDVDPNDGWYSEATITIIRRVLRAELVSLASSKGVFPVEERHKIVDEVSESMNND